MASRQIRPIRVEGNIAYVPLTRGYEAVIDIADVPLVEGFNWSAMPGRRTMYGYRKVRTPEQKSIRLHCAILGFAWGGEIDHVDGDGLNNRRSNLRPATRSQNQHNAGVRADNASGFKGVWWSEWRKKWRAGIRVNHKAHHLGYYDTAAEAAAAYAAASIRLHGEFGRVS